MRLVDAYGGGDDRSMAADNTSGYNCRRVPAAQLVRPRLRRRHRPQPGAEPLPDRRIGPAAGRADGSRDRPVPGALVPAGVIRADDVVVRAFAAIGWEWGGTWADPDYQHFAAR